jgi:acetyl esterase/lipase
MSHIQRVDAELRPALQAAPDVLSELGHLSGGDLIAELRTRGQALARPFLLDPKVEERTISGIPDSPAVKVFVINSAPALSKPAILHMHGGGFFLGSAAAAVADLQVQARALDCVIVTVDYRLAPETPFPGSLNDNYGALEWLYRNAISLGVDRSRIALAGESAGGGHAAMLAIAARDRGEIPICFQALTFPMLDDRTGSSRKTPPHIGAIGWTAQFNRFGWSALLGSRAGGETAPPGAVPARQERLADLPPTFICVGDIDLFVEENMAFAQRLVVAGVPIELLVLPGAPHGFFGLAPDASVSRRYQLAYLNALARAFSQSERSVAAGS